MHVPDYTSVTFPGIRLFAAINRDATGSMIVVGSSDGCVAVLKTPRDGAGSCDLRMFQAHDGPISGVRIVGSQHFLSWGRRQQFALLWRIL